MKTQLKVLKVANVDLMEGAVNKWLEENTDISIHSIHMYPVYEGGKPVLAVIMIYSQETWR